VRDGAALCLGDDMCPCLRRAVIGRVQPLQFDMGLSVFEKSAIAQVPSRAECTLLLKNGVLSVIAIPARPRRTGRNARVSG
jgi:hypothetical protein